MQCEEMLENSEKPLVEALNREIAERDNVAVCNNKTRSLDTVKSMLCCRLKGYFNQWRNA